MTTVAARSAAKADAFAAAHGVPPAFGGYVDMLACDDTDTAGRACTVYWRMTQHRTGRGLRGQSA